MMPICDITEQTCLILQFLCLNFLNGSMDLRQALPSMDGEISFAFCGCHGG
jgi:hypothetical protein